VRGPLTIALELGENLLNLTPYGAFVPIARNVLELGGMGLRELGVLPEPGMAQIPVLPTPPAVPPVKEKVGTLKVYDPERERVAVPQARPFKTEPTGWRDTREIPTGMCVRLEGAAPYGNAIHLRDCRKVQAALHSDENSMMVVPCTPTTDTFPAPCCRPEEYIAAAKAGQAPPPIDVSYGLTKSEWGVVRDGYYGRGVFDPRKHIPNPKYASPI
jgi:hypothetical protein